jgi:hypothetical protein
MTTLPRLIAGAVLAGTIVVLAAAPASPAANTQSSRLGRAACALLNASGFPGIPNAADLTEIGKGCEAGECMNSRTDPDSGAILCHYGRNALLSVGCHPSRSAAVALVRNVIRHKGFQRARLDVDAAAVQVWPERAEVAMALGRETVGFIMDAFSDDDPNPMWTDVKRDTLKGAQTLVPAWRHLERRICAGS